MDATQLSLFLTAKLQSSSKMTLQLNDDSNSTDKVFADLLKQRAAEESEQERQTERDRQNWRNQPPSYTPSQVSSSASTTSSSSSSTDNTVRSAGGTSATSSAAAAKTSRQAVSQGNNASANTSQRKNTTQSGAADDRNTTTTARKPDKTKDTTGTDDSQTADDQPAFATADGGTASKHQAVFDQGQSGDNSSGNGQNQGQPGQDDGQQQQQQADGTGDGTAMATTVEGAILAGLMITQPIVTPSASGSQAAAGGLQIAGLNVGGAGTQGDAGVQGLGAPGIGTQGTSTQGTGAQAAIAAAAAQANAALSNSLSDAVAATTSGSGTAGADIAAAAGLSQGAGATAGASTSNRPSPQDLAASFANMVAKNTSSTAANGEAARVSITKTDGAPQMPKPLVKIDSDHAALSGTEAASSTSESDTAGVDTAAPLGTAAIDDGDDFRSFGSYSPLLANGSGSVVIGKQADPLAALRQQLASASVQDQVAIHLQRAVKDSVDKISIQLSPTELGQIHVKMKVDDDKNVTASITVERPSTLDLLQRDTKTLERALQEAGLKTDTGSLSFSLQRGNQGDSSDTPGWGQGNGRRVGSSGQENSAGTAEISAATAGNEIDTANGLVNVAV